MLIKIKWLLLFHLSKCRTVIWNKSRRPSTSNSAIAYFQNSIVYIGFYDILIVADVTIDMHNVPEMSNFQN